MADPRDQLSKDFLEIAKELLEASKHAEVASKHFSDKEIPRACAHATAVQGHILAAENLIKEFQLIHRMYAKAGE